MNINPRILIRAIDGDTPSWLSITISVLIAILLFQAVIRNLRR